MAPRALFDELDLALLDLCSAGCVLRRLGKGLVAARRGLRYCTAAELEGDNAIDVLVFGGSAARWDCVARDIRAAVSDLNGHILFAIDRIGHRCRHDVTAGLDRFQHLAGVSSVHPQLAAAATLKHQVGGGAQYAAVVSPHT